MAEFEVAEKFLSINGEGLRAGQPAVFIRFKGCNLHCSYCDTRWANGAECPCEIMTEDEIAEYIVSYGVHCVTLTGGEPMLRSGFDVLCSRLMKINELRIEIETNGSADISEISRLRGGHTDRLTFTMDYKLPSSGMEKFMNTENMQYLTADDTVKFVCGSKEDLKCARRVIAEYGLEEKCNTLFSPVFGKIDPKDIVEFILENRLMNSRFQLQIHKFVWDPELHGV